MIEALRGLGYSTATALADLVDNSIAADAGNVDLTFVWKGADSHITIQDDGWGMDDAGLDRAMRLGHQSPLDGRAANDLGRFGLGLKTASFSQGRRLTVASRQKSGAVACLRWDLDVLASSDDDTWRLLVGPADGSHQLLDPLQGGPQGTLVLWENLDRIVTPGFSEENFLDLIDIIERHLAMVFHRYLTGKPPRLRIAINDRAVTPWDPFLAAHHATWSSPTATLAPGVAAQCHVLPHKDRLDRRQDEEAAGLDGWTAQQGFYVYRNQRLLVAGSWLGLGRGRPWTKEEAHRLARIRIDIPNSADAAWKIDIRKSTARPPVALRQDLTHLMEDTCRRARRVFAHRGRIAGPDTGGPVVQAWRAERLHDGMRYRIEAWLVSARKQGWRYWPRYREWLDARLPATVIDHMERSTNDVLGQLEDPLRPGAWDRRGLVVGSVQSGKTGHYIGLVSKAADAGYKIVIVLAGLHNNLRSQTQMRLDEGFLGYETRPRPDEDLRRIGVGTVDGDPSIQPNFATNRTNSGDFTTRVATNLGISPEERPWLFVVKIEQDRSQPPAPVDQGSRGGPPRPRDRAQGRHEAPAAHDRRRGRPRQRGHGRAGRR